MDLKLPIQGDKRAKMKWQTLAYAIIYNIILIHNIEERERGRVREREDTIADVYFPLRFITKLI